MEKLIGLGCQVLQAKLYNNLEPTVSRIQSNKNANKQQWPPLPHLLARKSYTKQVSKLGCMRKEVFKSLLLSIPTSYS